MSRSIRTGVSSGSTASQDTQPGDAAKFKRTYWDSRFGVTGIRVFPGDYYVTRTPGEMIVTTLGSCVAACIRDRVTGVGGLNHFMLPESETGAWGDASASLRYGNYAMEQLINEILKLGGARSRLEVKVFGGAHVLRNRADVGRSNADFVAAYLAEEGLPIAASELYGEHPRRVHYFPSSGRAAVLLLRRSELSEVTPETRYRDSLAERPTVGSVELF